MSISNMEATRKTLPTNRDDEINDRSTQRTCTIRQLPATIAYYSKKGYALHYHRCCQSFSSRDVRTTLEHTSEQKWGELKSACNLPRHPSAAQLVTGLKLGSKPGVAFNYKCSANPENSEFDQEYVLDKIEELEDRIEILEAIILKFKASGRRYDDEQSADANKRFRSTKVEEEEVKSLNSHNSHNSQKSQKSLKISSSSQFKRPVFKRTVIEL